MDLKPRTPQPAALAQRGCGRVLGRDAASVLSISLSFSPVKTLYRWRLEKQGPPCLRVGKHLRYVPEDVVAWVESRKQLAS
jgi:hypothetical protein